MPKQPTIRMWMCGETAMYESGALVAARTRGKAKAAMMSIEGCSWDFTQYTARRVPQYDYLINTLTIDGEEFDCDDYAAEFIKGGRCGNCVSQEECVVYSKAAKGGELNE